MMNSFMYKHPYRKGSGKLTLLALLTSFLFLAIPLAFRPLAAVPVATANGPGALILFGTVYDSGGNTVEGADVTVTVIGGTAAPQDTVSIAGGFYTVTFDLSEWTPGNFVKVVASFGGESGENQTQTTTDLSYQIDVHLAAAIPEFPSILPIVGAAAVMVTIISGWRRPKMRKNPQEKARACDCHLRFTEE